MKLPRLPLLLVFLGFAVHPFDMSHVVAQDQVPPVPPGNSLPPPPSPSSTPTAPGSQSSGQQSIAGSNKKQSGEQRFEKLKQALSLTHAQAAKIKPILEKAAQQVKALRTSVSMSAAQKKQQIRQILASSFQQIRPLLTPQQLQKWRQLHNQRRNQSQTVTT
jgi:Spy/CpxP family protein refolding chaperone